MGNTISFPFNSASILGPSAAGGSVKLSVEPKIVGYDCRITSLIRVWLTSASSRNAVVSDQFRTETLSVRPFCDVSSDSIRVNGQGPAMQVKRTLRSSLPSGASAEYVPIDAFHRLSGEQGGMPPHRTFPVLLASNVWARLSMFVVVVALLEYLIRTLPITASALFCTTVRAGALDAIRATTISPSSVAVNSSGWYPACLTLSASFSPPTFAGRARLNSPETSDLPEAVPERAVSRISAFAIGTCFLGSLSSTSTTPVSNTGFPRRMSWYQPTQP